MMEVFSRLAHILLVPLLLAEIVILVSVIRWNIKNEREEKRIKQLENKQEGK